MKFSKSAIEEIMKAAAQEQFEKDCWAMCRLCREGSVPIYDKKVSKFDGSGYGGWCHGERLIIANCAASPIRENNAR